MKFDFSGRAASTGVRCSDGTVFHRGAFSGNDGKIVPLVWMHNHEDPEYVLGSAYLKNGPDGLDVYGSFNDTELGQLVKEQVQHGDIRQLSVWANHLNRQGNDLYNGDVKEVSLVLAGADPTARIEQTSIMHSDVDADGNEILEAEIYSGDLIDNEPGELVEHSEKEEPNEEKVEPKKETTNMAAAENQQQGSGKTVKEIFDSLTDEQKQLVYFLVGQAMEDKSGASANAPEAEDDEAEHYDMYDGGYMKTNVFDNGAHSAQPDFISHSEQEDILKDAKKSGMTFQSALNDYLDEAGIEHADGADVVAGFDDTSKVFDNRTSLNLMFPDFQEANGNMPELITSDQGWITRVLAKVKKAPYTRVRTSEVDIRNIDALRAKGYQKGNKKALTGNYGLIRRTTDPQTVYVRSSLNRDDIVDITDFDYVQYQYNIDKLMLNEEVATAIMLGDSREDGIPDKIFPEHIRPIWTDDDLFVKHVSVDLAAARKELQGSDTSKHFGDNYVYAEAIIEALLHAREQDFRGSGTPDFYCTPALMNKMLLARDFNGRRIYNSKAELQSALNIGEMITAEQFTGRVRTDSNGKKHKLLGIVGNLNDYQVGSTKGGQISHFTQFDIDFNQEKSLIETRLSGAVTRIYSFIVLEEDVADTTPAAEG